MAHLLIVEDQKELAALMEAAAKLRGHTSAAFHAGADALAAINGAGGQRYDAAVVDLLLPDIKGSEVLRALNDRALPAFAMSGVYKGDRFAREAVEVHGARAFFEKPFDLDELLDAVEEAVQERRAAANGTGDGPRRVPLARFGPVDEGTIPRVMNACYHSKHTGELRLKQGQVQKVISFEAGQPVHAASNLAQERFGRFCARRGLITDQEAQAVAALSRDENLTTGEAMVRLGLITHEDRRKLLEEQIKDIIWSTFTWTTGEYAFAPKVLREDRVRLAVFPGSVILEGAAREPLVSLRRKVPASRRYFPIPDAAYALHELRLDNARAHLLMWADGTKSVEDLVALSDLPERDVLGALYGFELLGLIEERQVDPTRRITFGL